ncbi:MAG: M28 family peptidase [Myxococcales bacterium]|nr:M28 family peptidase [Myxococcales bacterium]
MLARSSALVFALVVACGGDDAGVSVIDAAPPDGAVAVDAPPVVIDAPVPIDGTAACASPDDCAWIDDELRTVVAVLSGAQPTPAGTTLVRRASAAERTAARAYLTGELARLGLTVEARTYGTGTNLVVHLAPTVGADVGPPLVVGGHFDGVAASPAAADNATGAAVAVVAAGYLAGRPRTRPIEVVLFDQEEAGLIGSGAYVAALAGAPIHSMHNFDMISFDGDGDRAVELWSPAPALEALYRLHATGRGLTIQPVTFALSDHESFGERGLPSVGVSEEFVANDHTPHYHRATDTLDKIDFAYLGAVARLGLAAIEDDAND